MFVRCKKRFKDGKEHRYWSVVENVRVRGGRPNKELELLLHQLGMTLPQQPAPRICA